MSETSSTRKVRGQIVIPHGVEPRQPRFVVVRVEDVSRADASSTVVGEQRLEGVRLEPGSSIPFEVDVPGGMIDERARYSVSVHVDVSGSGEVERGDLVSTQSHPVLTRDSSDEATVPVRQV